MIPITPVLEPSDFDMRVRRPGATFLATTPNPTTRQWDRNAYWRRVLQDLHSMYGGMCAYCGSWTSLLTGTSVSRPLSSSVDHFIPKSITPDQAYEWDNFRLSRTRLNERKGNHQDVIDPFLLPPGWFHLSFLTFRLMASAMLSVHDKRRVWATINRLQLNDDDDYVNERINIIKQYCLRNVSFAQVASRYPFVALEMKRQSFDSNYLPRMASWFREHP